MTELRPALTTRRCYFVVCVRSQPSSQVIYCITQHATALHNPQVLALIIVLVWILVGRHLLLNRHVGPLMTAFQAMLIKLCKFSLTAACINIIHNIT